MKKIILSLGIIFLSGLFLYSQPTATISIPHLGNMPPGELYTPFIVEEISPGYDFGNFQFFIFYDPDILIFEELVLTNPDLQWYELSFNVNLGIITYLGFTGITPVPGEELFQIKWQYTGYGFPYLYWDEENTYIKTTSMVLYDLTLIYEGLGQPSATISLPHLTSVPAGEVITPIIVEDISTGSDFGKMQLFIYHDYPAPLTPLELIATNPNMPFYEWTFNLDYNPEVLTMTWLSLSGGFTPSSGEELCQVKWQYTGPPDYSDLNWLQGDSSYTLVWTSTDTLYDLTLIDGSVSPLTGLNKFEAGSSIKIWSANQSIYVNNTENETGSAIIFNMMGQEVIKSDIETGLIVFPVKDNSTYYIVKVIIENNTLTEKVFLSSPF